MKIESGWLSGPIDPGAVQRPKPGETASDFEALMIGQMLKSARSDSGGWFGTGEDTTSTSLIEMAEEQIAKVIAQGGGLGLSKLIERALDQPAASSTVQMSGKLR